MPTARTYDGVAISYETRGDGPPDLLFMHGWAGSGSYLCETLEHLDLSRLRVTTIDLRGHGDSDKPAEGYTLDGFAADAVAVADAVGAERFVLLGYSMGAKFAQYVALRAPERVSGLVLVAGCPVSEIPLPQQMLDDWYGRAGDAARLIELERGFATRPVAEHLFEQFGREAAKVPRVALEGSLSACIATSFADAIGAVRAPTLVVGGIHDPIFTPDALRAGVVGPLPRARLALLDSNHEIPVEQPRELAGLVEAFLAGLGGS